MDFISGIFLVFLLLCIVTYYLIPKKGQPYQLLLFSLLFYLYGGVKVSVFIIFSIVSSYFAARLIQKNMDLKHAEADVKRQKRLQLQAKLLLVVTILINLAILFLLKTAGSGTLLAERLHITRFAILLPMGISFYTLQVIAYLVDIYQGKEKAEKNLLKYALFVSFFPQVLQGPIPRWSELKNQLFTPHAFEEEKVVFGFERMLWGYFQKLVIADRAAVMVNRLFGEYQTYSGVYLILAGVLYSIQLYTDFSGCVNIACGASQMLGIKLTENFKQPYFATSIQDFWHRWHISLSTWLKDYVYIPLGGNRKGKLRKYVNLLITFAVSGLWHGIGMHYMVWGLLHGIYQVIGQILKPARDIFAKILYVNREAFSHRLFKQIFTFILVMLAWVFFRASSVSQAVAMIRGMVTTFNPWVLWDGSLFLLGLDAKNVWLLLFAIILLWIVSFCQTRFQIRKALARQGIAFRYVVVYLLLFAVLIFGIYGPGYDIAQFIYGNF